MENRNKSVLGNDIERYLSANVFRKFFFFLLQIFYQVNFKANIYILFSFLTYIKGYIKETRCQKFVRAIGLILVLLFSKELLCGHIIMK